MRHRKSGRQLGMNSSHRKAMFRNMVTSLFENGSITTTDARAKELRRVADRLVTLGKKGTLHAKRLAARQIRTREVLAKLFDEIGPGFQEREGGYTRIIKLENRRGDNAPMALIELMPPGAPETKGAPKMAPSLKKSGATPTTKERFDAGDED